MWNPAAAVEITGDSSTVVASTLLKPSIFVRVFLLVSIDSYWVKRLNNPSGLRQPALPNDHASAHSAPAARADPSSA